MPSPFAALEARSAAACFKFLANADTLLDGQPVSGVFDAAYAQFLDGMASTRPMFAMPSDLALATTQTSVLVARGVTYRVRSVEPDGTGITRLLLERS